MQNFLKTAQIDWNKLNSEAGKEGIPGDFNKSGGVNSDCANALGVVKALVTASVYTKITDYETIKNSWENIVRNIKIDKSTNEISFGVDAYKDFTKMLDVWEKYTRFCKWKAQVSILKKFAEAEGRQCDIGDLGVKFSGRNLENKRDFDKLLEEIDKVLNKKKMSEGAHGVVTVARDLSSSQRMTNAAKTVGKAVKKTFSREGAKNIAKALGIIGSKVKKAFNSKNHDVSHNTAATQKTPESAQSPAAPTSQRNISVDNITISSLKAVQNLQVINDLGFGNTVEELWALNNNDLVAKVLLFLSAMVGVSPEEADHVSLDSYLGFILSPTTLSIDNAKVVFLQNPVDNFKKIVKKLKEHYNNKGDSDSVEILVQLRDEKIVDGISSTTKKNFDVLCREIEKIFKARWKESEWQRKKQRISNFAAAVRYHQTDNLKKQINSGVNNQDDRTIKQDATLKNSQVRLLRDFNERYIHKWLEAGKVSGEDITNIFTNEKTEKFNKLQDALQAVYDYLRTVNNKTNLKSFVSDFYDKVSELRKLLVEVDRATDEKADAKAEIFGKAENFYAITHVYEAFVKYFSYMHNFVERYIGFVNNAVSIMIGFDEKKLESAKPNSSGGGVEGRILRGEEFKEWSNGSGRNFVDNMLVLCYGFGAKKTADKNTTKLTDPTLQQTFKLMADNLKQTNGDAPFPFDSIKEGLTELRGQFTEVTKSSDESANKFKKLSLPKTSSIYKYMQRFMNAISGLTES